MSQQRKTIVSALVLAARPPKIMKLAARMGVGAGIVDVIL
jgi:hypothetical protein